MNNNPFIDVQEVFTAIKQDIIDNAEHIFNESEYYTRKYRGDILNDINVGVFLNDELVPTVQIFVSNKYLTIKQQILFTKDCRKIYKELEPVIIKHTNPQNKIKIVEFEHSLYNEDYTLEEAIMDKKAEVLEQVINRSIEDIDNAITIVKQYPRNNRMTIEMYIDTSNDEDYE